MRGRTDSAVTSASRRSIGRGRTIRVHTASCWRGSGVDAPLTALQWLASHGCDADGALDEATALVGTYQDSPERTAMLASLRRLHRRP